MNKYHFPVFDSVNPDRFLGFLVSNIRPFGGILRMSVLDLYDKYYHGPHGHTPKLPEVVDFRIKHAKFMRSETSFEGLVIETITTELPYLTTHASLGLLRQLDGFQIAERHSKPFGSYGEKITKYPSDY